MVKKLILVVLCFNALVLGIIFFQDFFSPPPPHQPSIAADEDQPPGKPVTIQLRDRPFTVYEFPTKKNPPAAMIIFGSGDGSWGTFEDALSHRLQVSGYTVIGIDSFYYAKNDYDLATLQNDYATIVQKEMETYKLSGVPVIVGGWSMGAAQAIAVGGGPNRPPNLVGLLLIAPCSRGRYGLRVSDRLDIPPKGPGTFAVEDFIPGLNGLRIAQWHAGNDIVDSTAWLTDLKAPHREYDYPNLGHDYGGGPPQLLDQMAQSVGWILNSSASDQ